MERLEEERRLQLDYTRAVIYVRQVDKNGLNGSTVEGGGGGGGGSTSLLDTSSSTPADQDPDFQVKKWGLSRVTFVLER